MEVGGRLLAVGAPGGTISGFSGIADGSGFLRLGAELMYLEAPRYRLWRATALAPERAGLLAWAAGDGIADAESLLRTLVDALLVAELRDEPRIPAARLAITLTGEGVGNGTGRDPAFAFLGRDGAAVRVSVLVFEALMRCDGRASIAQACEPVQAAAPPGAPAVLQGLCAALPLLMRHGIVRLDLAGG